MARFSSLETGTVSLLWKVPVIVLCVFGNSHIMEFQRGANVNTMGPAGARTPGCAVARSGSRVVAY